VNETYIKRFEKLLQELLSEGYGKVSLEVYVKKSKVEYISLTKSATHQIDVEYKKS